MFTFMSKNSYILKLVTILTGLGYLKKESVFCVSMKFMRSYLYEYNVNMSQNYL